MVDVFFWQQMTLKSQAQALQSDSSWNISGVHSSRAATAPLHSSHTAHCGDTEPPDAKVLKCMNAKQEWIGFKQLIATVTCLLATHGHGTTCRNPSVRVNIQQLVQLYKLKTQEINFPLFSSWITSSLVTSFISFQAENLTAWALFITCNHAIIHIWERRHLLQRLSELGWHTCDHRI